MKIRKALVAAAGFGTRFLPITKTIQKEMLPVLNRPTVDYLVEDLIKAGVEEIIFVISEHNKQLIHYYRENPRLFGYLQKHGKQDLYSQVSKIHQQAQFHFIKQTDDDLYGTATPLKLAKSYLENEPAFFVFMGDDFLFDSQSDRSESAKMLDLYQKSRASGLIACIQKPINELSRYGVLKPRALNEYAYLESIIEKPSAGEAPSNLVNISKYILTPKVFPILAKQQLDQKSGEFYIIDTIATLAKTDNVVIYQPEGKYLDCGQVMGWLEANLTLALASPQYSQLTRELITKIK